MDKKSLDVTRWCHSLNLNICQNIIACQNMLREEGRFSEDAQASSACTDMYFKTQYSKIFGKKISKQVSASYVVNCFESNFKSVCNSFVHSALLDLSLGFSKLVSWTLVLDFSLDHIISFHHTTFFLSIFNHTDLLSSLLPVPLPLPPRLRLLIHQSSATTCYRPTSML